MKIGNMSIQLSGIDLASLKEEEILAHIKAHCIENGFNPETIGDINVYINIEGTAVTAYYACDDCKGAIRLN